MTGVKDRVRAFVHGPLNAPTLGDDESFWDTRAVDSIGILQLIRFLQTEFQLEVPGREVTSTTFASISAVAAYVSARLPDANEPR